VKRERDTAICGKMLVRIVSIHTQEAGDSAPLSTQAFAVCTEHGELESRVAINELQRCYPPPESQLYRVVDLDLTSLTGRAHLTLPRAYKNYVTLVSHRQAIQQSAAGAGQLSTSVSVSSEPVRDAAGRMTQPAASSSASSSSGQAVQQASQQLATHGAAASVIAATTSPAEPSLSQLQLLAADGGDAAVNASVDLTQASALSTLPSVDLPCVLCGVTLSSAEYVFCYYRPCQAPLHKPGAGCTRWDRAVVVDSMLYYCRQYCARLDHSGDGASTSGTQVQHSQVPPAAADGVAATPARASVGASGQHRAATAAAATSGSVMHQCSSCLEPVQWSAGASCPSCSAYHHKIPRGKAGCTRAGWSKEGSRSVQGMIQCVACRYQDDGDWKRFNGNSAGST
jgi:hypothetical protein